MTARQALIAAFMALLCFGRPTGASAHAIVLESVPRAGTTVSEPKLEVVIRFSSRIDRARSHLALIGGDGKERALALLADTAPDLLRADVTGLAAGRYRLRWQVL